MPDNNIKDETGQELWDRLCLESSAFKAGQKSVVEWVEGHKPTRPDNPNTTTQYSYYAIDEHEVEAFKKEQNLEN